MALIDDIFGGIPKNLLADFGRDITYVKAGLPQTYNPTTAAVTNTETTVTVKALISSVNIAESEGLYQSTDIKVIFGADELGTYYPLVADRLRYTQAGETREAKIFSVVTQRGDDPILHTVIARPQ